MRAQEIAAQVHDQKDGLKLYGTLFPEDGREDARPFTMCTPGEGLHEVLNADTDDTYGAYHTY